MDDALRILDELDDFLDAGVESKRRASKVLAAKLGEGWTSEPLARGLDALPLAHAPSGLRFVAVPGGAFEMGFSSYDRGTARDFMEHDADAVTYAEELTESARPPRNVRVRPFLLARSLVEEQNRFIDVDRSEALARAAALGFRLPSEAELEWVGRDGGELTFILEGASEVDPAKLVSRFGVKGFHFFQWAADDWHATYAGAPSDSRPWLGGDASGVYRSGFDLRGMQSRGDLALALAAVRYRGEPDQPCRVRLARDLPRG